MAQTLTSLFGVDTENSPDHGSGPTYKCGSSSCAQWYTRPPRACREFLPSLFRFSALHSLHRGFFEDRVRAFGGDDAQICHGSLLPLGSFVFGIALGVHKPTTPIRRSYFRKNRPPLTL